MTHEIREIRAAILSGEVNKSDLARHASINRNSIRCIEDEDWNPRFKTVRDLSAALREIRIRNAAANKIRTRG